MRRRLEGGAASSSGGSTAVPDHVQPLNESMGQDWPRRVLTSQQVVNYCAGAILLGAKGTEVEKFAKCASWGKHRQNAQRDLMKAFGRPAGAPALYRAKLPVKARNGEREFSDHPFALPHELFARMYQDRRAFFQEHVMGEKSALKECWATLEKHEFVQENQAWAEARAAGFELVPLGLHCDAGAFSNNESLYVLTWNSLVGQGTTKQKRYIITVLKKSSLMPDGSTLDEMWKVVAWSLNALATGNIQVRTTRTKIWMKSGRPWGAHTWVEALQGLRCRCEAIGSGTANAFTFLNGADPFSYRLIGNYA